MELFSHLLDCLLRQVAFRRARPGLLRSPGCLSSPLVNAQFGQPGLVEPSSRVPLARLRSLTYSRSDRMASASMPAVKASSPSSVFSAARRRRFHASHESGKRSV